MSREDVPVTTYFLEMHQEPGFAALALPEGATVMQAQDTTANFYRFLYREVGEPWLWYERWSLGDEEILSAISDAEIHVLRVRGVPAGYVELLDSAPQEKQIIYFGLMSEFLGQGLGRPFLDWAVRHSFARGASRLWVHTCSLDHENALSTYQRAGFREFRRESGRVSIPLAAQVRKRNRRPTGPKLVTKK